MQAKMSGVIDLTGTWQLAGSDGQRGRLEQAEREAIDPTRWIEAQVPGSVHLDLWRAGRIADPYVAANVLAARWVEEFQWTYRRSFELPSVPPGRVWLVFEGLDLDAVILLNGQEVGRHGNAFYPCRIEVTGRLREGSNWLIVHLDSGLWGACDKPARGYEHWPDQILNKRHWLRKPQFQFGWDWAQRLINVGIFKPVRLEWIDQPMRAGQLVPLTEVSDDLQRASVRVRWFVEGLDHATHEGRLTVELLEAGITDHAAIQLRPGENLCEQIIEIDRPRLWWPVGEGEPARYTLRATLELEGGEVARREMRIGFRHVRFDQSPHPAGGRYFTLEINRRKVFARGANFVPADMILARIDRARYDKLISLALEQNLNFLRVWGGGLYESDDFYDLCDERGLLVWQEFAFACSRYPTTDQSFVEEVTKEATWNIRRLAGHPSLIAWCGNNEIEWGDWDWDYGRRGVILPDHGFFHITLPRLLSHEDPTRYYHPSSPFSPDGLHPNDDRAGDQHPWSVGFFNDDLREYRRMACRFASEGGTLGPTALPTMLACLPEDQRRVGSFPWQVHDNSVSTWTQPSMPDEFLRKWLGKEPREMSIEQFTYWAGLLQGEALREYCENFRRRMFDSSAAVFWMLNDCWPATRSWTTIDYFLRRTPAFWAVRRAMKPVHVVLAVVEEQVIVFGINQTPQAVAAQVEYGVMPLANPPAETMRCEATLPSGTCTPVASFALSQWSEPDKTAAFARFERTGELLAQNRLLIPRFSELCWPAAEVQVRREGRLATFTSRTFAWGVCLDLIGEEPLFDNLFDLYPGRPYTIPWPRPQPPEIQFVGNLPLRT